MPDIKRGIPPFYIIIFLDLSSLGKVEEQKLGSGIAGPGDLNLLFDVPYEGSISSLEFDVVHRDLAAGIANVDVEVPSTSRAVGNIFPLLEQRGKYFHILVNSNCFEGRIFMFRLSSYDLTQLLQFC